MSVHDAHATAHTNREYEQVWHRIVEAVAEREGTTPFDLRPPLYYTVNPEALERLLGGNAEITVTFEYNGYVVTVRNDGSVLVDRITSDDDNERPTSVSDE